MKGIARIVSIFLTTTIFANFSQPREFAPGFSDKPQLIVINNRPLAKVNGKVISLLDVVKKMDLYIHERMPEISDSKINVYQFYMASWEATLEDLVKTELILRDAEELDLKISDGEIREEVESKFGPNIMTNLNDLNMTLDQAKELVRTELITRRMSWFKIHSIAVHDITPTDIKNSYLSYCKANPAKETWNYQVLSIRSPDKESCMQYAKKASTLIGTTCSNLSTLLSKLTEEKPPENLKVSVSTDYSKSEKEISSQHKEILMKLADGEYSDPIIQKSRHSNDNVCRLFHLKSKTLQEVPTFESMYKNINNKLINTAIDQIEKVYIDRLKEKYGVQIFASRTTENFEPFVLQ